MKEQKTNELNKLIKLRQDWAVKWPRKAISDQDA